MLPNNMARAQASSNQEASAPAAPYSDEPILASFPDVGTITDVAHALQLKPSAARLLCREKKIRAIKCGNLWRVPRAWLIEFIENGGCNAN